MPLEELYCHGTPVDDLSALVTTQLDTLDCSATRVTDLRPLLQLTKLEQLRCDERLVRESSFLQDHPNRDHLWINDRPAAEFWQDVERR